MRNTTRIFLLVAMTLLAQYSMARRSNSSFRSSGSSQRSVGSRAQSSRGGTFSGGFKAAPQAPAVSRPSIARPSVVRPSVSRPAPVQRPAPAPTPARPANIAPARPTVTRPQAPVARPQQPAVTKPSVTQPAVAAPKPQLQTKPQVKPQVQTPEIARPRDIKPLERRPDTARPSLNRDLAERPKPPLSNRDNTPRTLDNARPRQPALSDADRTRSPGRPQLARPGSSERNTESPLRRPDNSIRTPRSESRPNATALKGTPRSIERGEPRRPAERMSLRSGRDSTPAATQPEAASRRTTSTPPSLRQRSSHPGRPILTGGGPRSSGRYNTSLRPSAPLRPHNVRNTTINNYYYSNKVKVRPKRSFSLSFGWYSPGLALGFSTGHMGYTPWPATYGWYGNWGYHPSSLYYSSFGLSWYSGWWGGYYHLHNPWPAYHSYSYYEPAPLVTRTEYVYVQQPASATIIDSAPVIVEPATTYPTQSYLLPETTNNAPVIIESPLSNGDLSSTPTSLIPSCFCACQCNGERPCVCEFPCGMEFAWDPNEFNLHNTFISFTEEPRIEAIWMAYAGLNTL